MIVQAFILLLGMEAFIFLTGNFLIKDLSVKDLSGEFSGKNVYK